MKICFYKAEYGTALDKLIAAVSFSKYSHCEIQFSDGMCASSSFRDGSVRFKYINLDSGHWDVFEFKSTRSEQTVRYWLELLKDEPYDYIGALFSTFYISVGDDKKKFCSEVCGFAVDAPDGLTPGALFRYMKKKGLIK